MSSSSSANRKRKPQRILTDYLVPPTSQTVTSIKARYQTLLRCLQSTASCVLALIMNLVHQNGEKKITEIEAIRVRIAQLVLEEEPYNLFYSNLTESFRVNNIASIIQILVATNISLSSLTDYVSPPDEDGFYLQEPIYLLYKFLLRLCNERPILVLSNDDLRGSNFSHIQENLEHFVSEQIFMVSIRNAHMSMKFPRPGINVSSIVGRGNRQTESTVTSKKARYQTLLKCLQSTTSCCLELLSSLVHKDEINTYDVIELKHCLTNLATSKEGLDFFASNLTQIFLKNDISKIIQVLVATNICLSSLETYVEPPDEESGSYLKEPIATLYRFLLRICYERPILVLSVDDARGTFCAYLQDSMEHFIAEQTFLKKEEFKLPEDSEEIPIVEEKIFVDITDRVKEEITTDIDSIYNIKSEVIL
jgi:hypothetical protein